MIADMIEEKLGKLSRTIGKKHTFLNIYLEFISGNKVAVSTPHHIDKDLEYFGETLKGDVVNPATSQLFTTINEAKDIDDKKRSVIT